MRDAQDQRLRALVVDWGGVLTEPLDGAMAGWAERERVDLRHFRAVMRGWVGPPDEAAAGAVGAFVGGDGQAGAAGSSPVHALERGEISVREFEQVLAEALTRHGSAVPAEGLLARMLGGLEPLSRDMVGLLRRARQAGVRTALLSNSWGDHYPEQLWDGLFDAVVISGRVGMRKPEPEIFAHTAGLLDVTPPECVMVDDLPHNVRGAVAAGMVGVVFVSYEQAAAELEILFDLPLR